MGKLEYHGSDLSTKLKLMGVDVASFGGDASFWTSRLFDLDRTSEQQLNIFSPVASDPTTSLCRRLVIQRNLDDGSFQLLGGVLVGDVSDYTKLRDLARKRERLLGTEVAKLTRGSSNAKLQCNFPAEVFSNGNCEQVQYSEKQPQIVASKL